MVQVVHRPCTLSLSLLLGVGRERVHGCKLPGPSENQARVISASLVTMCECNEANKILNLSVDYCLSRHCTRYSFLKGAHVYHGQHNRDEQVFISLCDCIT